MPQVAIFWRFNQSCGVVLNALDNLSAISAEIDPRWLMILETVFLDTPRIFANSDTVSPNGFKYCRHRIPPG